jgi:hypothetical protein
MRAVARALSFFVAMSVGLVLVENEARALPVACIVCGSTPIAAPGIEGTVSYAVISGADFAGEVAAHVIGFFGAVPSGTLGPARPSRAR